MFNLPGFSIWNRHSFGSANAMVSKSCICPIAETTANLDEIEGMNFKKKGSITVCIGETALSILKS